MSLFAAIFAFVTRFPTPSPQDVNQFEASLSQNASGITSLRIYALSGPNIPSSDRVYLQSSRATLDWQFSQVGGIPVAWGVGNSSGGWNAGQYWTTTFSPVLLVPTNITVYILSSTTLLYNAVVPGVTGNTPPIVTSTYTLPSTISVGKAFQIFAVISGNTTSLAVNVSLGAIPGLSGTQTMTYNKTVGAWAYSVPAGKTTTNGTYMAFVQGSGPLGTVAGSVTVTIGGASSGGGGGSSSSLSVSVGMSPQPPTLPQQTPSAYFWATITYPGSQANVPVWVNFTITQNVGGRSGTLLVSNTIPGQTGLTVSGPSSLTVYSQTAYNFNSWLLNTSVQVTATATLGDAVGTATGSISFQTANLIAGMVYVTTSSTGSTSNIETTFSHACGATCPYIYAEIWDNFTAAMGGPATVTVSGVAWANTTTGATHDYEIPTTGVPSTTVTQTTSPLFLNLNGGTTRENEIASAGTYRLSLWLTVKSTATGTPTIGYIYDSFAMTVT